MDIVLDEHEIKKLSDLADSEGQITKDQFKTYCHKSELFKSLDKSVLPEIINLSSFSQKQRRCHIRHRAD